MSIVKIINGLLAPTGICLLSVTNNNVIDLGLSGNKYSVKITDPDALKTMYILTDLTFGNFTSTLTYDMLNPSGFVTKYNFDNWVFFNEAYDKNYVANPKISFDFNFDAANELIDERLSWLDIYTYDFNRQSHSDFEILHNSNVYETPYSNGNVAEFNNGTLETDYKFYFGVILNDKDLASDRSITDWMQICAHRDENNNITYLSRFNIKNWPPDYPPSGDTPSLGFYVALREKITMVIKSPNLSTSSELRVIRIVNKHLKNVIY